MESPCRRIPVEVSDLDGIHRKSHAFCLATTPPRIIETPLILPIDPKSGGILNQVSIMVSNNLDNFTLLGYFPFCLYIFEKIRYLM